MQAASLPDALFHQDHGPLRLRSDHAELSRRRRRTSALSDARHGRDTQSRGADGDDAGAACRPCRQRSRPANARGPQHYLSKLDLEWDFAQYLWLPVSHANDNDPTAPMARYLVIHDTSGPNFGHRAFPEAVDNGNSKINSLNKFRCSDGWGKAHVVINRSGDMLLNHELEIPWRETKFEQAANFSGAVKGLFLHVELIQPRRAASGHGRHNDAQSPNPAG
jgi:hypothetical protein